MGTWIQRNNQILRQLGLSDSQTIKQIATDCICSNIRLSSAQWQFHTDRPLHNIDLASYDPNTRCCNPGDIAIDLDENQNVVDMEDIATQILTDHPDITIMDE